MTRAAALLGLTLMLAAGACQSGSINQRANDRPNGGNAGPGGPGAPGGGTGPSGPGSGAGGTGNGSTPGGSGMGAPTMPAGPATLPDAGAGEGDGGLSPPGGMSGCQVDITPLNPPRLDNLLAGATARLRVRAQVRGGMAPAAPAWQWQVKFGLVSDVGVTKVSPEGDTIEFPLATDGLYAIQAIAAPGCQSELIARAVRPTERMTTYWARITPPRSTNLPTHESRIMLGGQSPMTKVVALSPGVPVKINPRNAQNESIRSFIRISSPASSIRFEGNNLSQEFRADLESGRPYDVLIVPQGTEAPVLLKGRTANQLQAEPFMFDPGVPVTGIIQRTQAGQLQPVADARVFLRAGNLPSSIGQSSASGNFELRARVDTPPQVQQGQPVAFQVSVIPGVASGLPEARLADVAGYALAPQPGSVQLTYAAIETAAVEVGIRSSDGQRAVPGARVRLDADPATLGALGRVGTFKLSPDGREVAAEGALRVEATTGAGGSASFARLPVGRYRALVAPPAGMTDAATTAATFEVKAGMAPAAITLVRPVKLTGRLLPASLSSGLKLLAIEADGPTPGDALAATVDATGQFSLSVAPGRSYRLQIEPAQERKLPRLFLGPHTAAAMDSAIGDVTLFEGVPFIGVLTNGQTPVPDAVVQIFCTGAPPDCMDEQAPQLDGARPLAETRAGADGRFQVHLPDPARWDL